MGQIDTLRKAGFTENEISKYVDETRSKLLSAGFSEKETNKYFGITEYDPKRMRDSMQTYISQDEPDSFWDKFLDSFKPSWAERRARSYKALVGATKSNLSPSKFEPTMKEALTQGYQNSVTGLIQRGKVPDNRIPAAAMKYLPTSQRIAMQTATVAGDLPFMTAGAIIGGVGGGPAAPLTAAGGAFALPAGLRKVYMDYYEKGAIQNWTEFYQRLGDAVFDTMKGEAIGVATAATGLKVPGAVSYPAEIATMTTLGAAMEGTVPEPKDFIDAAILIGGMKLSGAVSARLWKNWTDTGEHPYGVVERMKENPQLQEEYLSSNFKPNINRIIEKGEKVSIDKPQGLYFSIGKKNPFEGDIKGEKIQAQISTKNVLNVPVEKISHKRFGSFGSGEISAGVSALKKLVPKEEFERLRSMSKKELIEELNNKYPGPEYDRYYDSYELLEAYGGQETRTRGYDAIQQIDKNNPDFSEFVALNKNAVKFAEDFIKNKKEKTAEEVVLDTIDIGGGKPKRTLKETLHDAYTTMVDELHPLSRVVKQMAEGEKVEVAKDPYKLSRLFKGVKGTGDHFLEYSPFTFHKKINTGKALRTILEPYKNDLDGVRAYLKSKRTLELDKRGIETGVPIDSAREVVKNGSEKYGQLFKDIQEYQTYVLTYLRDSGLVSRETFEKIKDLNKDYVPFYRAVEKQRGSAGKGLETYDPLKSIKGSELKTVDPLESIIKNTYLFTNLAEKNRIGSSLIKLAEARQGMGKFVKKIKKPMRPIELKAEETGLPEDLTIFRPQAFYPKEDQIRVWFNGKDQLFQVHPDIARVFKSLDSESLNLLTKVLSVPARWLRAGAILSPEFIARNPIRDQFSAFIFSKWGFVPGYNLIKGMSSAIRKDEYYREWQKSGGMMSEITALDRKYIQKGIGETLAKYPVLNRIKYGANPVEMLRVLSELSEQGTRLGEFRAARRKGASLEEAGFASREVTLDFARIGAKTKALNSMVAFWNANIQGFDKMIRAFKDNPIATTAKVTAGITIPSMILAAINSNDGRWDDIPRWQKDLFWIVMPGHVSKEKWAAMTSDEKAIFMENNHIWRIPKPFELGIMFGTIPERFVESIMEKDPEVMNGWIETIGRGVTPGVLPTISIPIIENWANKSVFLDRPLIPASKEGLLPEYQYKAYTTEAAKAIAKLLGKLPPIKENPNIAPVKIENLIRGWSGGLGFHVLKLASLGLEKSGFLPTPERPTKTLSDIPFIKAFAVRYPAAGSENINKFYEDYFSVQKRWKTFKYLLEKELNPREAAKIIVGHEDELVKMDGIYKALSTMHQSINLIHNNPSMSGNEKHQLIDRIYFDMSKIATIGNQTLKEIKNSIKQGESK